MTGTKNDIDRAKTIMAAELPEIATYRDEMLARCDGAPDEATKTATINAIHATYAEFAAETSAKKWIERSEVWSFEFDARIREIYIASQE